MSFKLEFLEFCNRPVSQGWSDIALQFLKILASLAPVSYRPVCYKKKRVVNIFDIVEENFEI